MKVDKLMNNEFKCCEMFCFVWGWVCQAFVWVPFFILCFGSVSENCLIAGISLFPVTYIMYMFGMRFTSTYNYLANIKKGTFHETMAVLVKAPIELKLHVACYHYETRSYSTTDSKGNIQHHNEQVRVNTHNVFTQVHFHSVRDVSGLLRLDAADTGKKYFVKVFLSKEAHFADAISYSDYLKVKEPFLQENKDKDKYFEYFEERCMDGFEELMLVQIGDYAPPFISKRAFMLFSVFTLGQFYRVYFDYICTQKEFTIRKVVSTRYNLLSQCFDHQYAAINPQLDLYGLKCSFETDQTGVVLEKPYPPPTEEELANAEQYNSYVPHYQTDDIGVVLDSYNLKNFNYNLLPPSFSNMLPVNTTDQVQQDANLNVNQLDEKLLPN